MNMESGYLKVEGEEEVQEKLELLTLDGNP